MSLIRHLPDNVTAEHRTHKRLSPQRDNGKCLEMLRLKTKVNQSMKCQQMLIFKFIYKTGGRNMTTGQAQAITNLFNALDRIPASRRGAAIAAAEKYLQEIRRLEAAGATPEEVKAAGDRIRAEYKSDTES